MPGKHSPTGTKSRAFIALTIVLVAMLLAGLYKVHSTTAFVDATTHQPERYTELYFTNPTNLPVNVVHGRQLAVAFTVHNLEARSMSYTYDVSFIAANGHVLSQKQGNLNESNDGSKAVTSSVSVPQTYRGKAEVQVALTNLENQSVHFWVQTR
jgi:uncharacterized membrane protein